MDFEIFIGRATVSSIVCQTKNEEEERNSIEFEVKIHWFNVYWARLIFPWETHPKYGTCLSGTLWINRWISVDCVQVIQKMIFNEHKGNGTRNHHTNIPTRSHHVFGTDFLKRFYPKIYRSLSPLQRSYQTSITFSAFPPVNCLRLCQSATVSVRNFRSARRVDAAIAPLLFLFYALHFIFSYFSRCHHLFDSISLIWYVIGF